MTIALDLCTIPSREESHSARLRLGGSGLINLRFAASVEERFELLEVLGEGGFADVYRARDLERGDFVAVKLLKHGMCDDAAQTAARFRQEAAILSALEHPSIPRLRDVGQLDGRACLVMEYIEGEDLGRRLERGEAMGPHRALRLVIEMLEALALGHARGIVHRDIKPSNIMLTGEGEDERLSILDFGVARRSLDLSRMSLHGVLVGTPRYYSPEYALGHVVTPALDVYQVGLLLIELMTTRHLVEGANAPACIKLLLRGGAKPPAVFEGTPLEGVLKRSLAFRTDDRYPDAAAQRDALLEILPCFPRDADAGWREIFAATTDAPEVTREDPPTQPAVVVSPLEAPTLPRVASTPAIEKRPAPTSLQMTRVERATWIDAPVAEATALTPLRTRPQGVDLLGRRALSGAAVLLLMSALLLICL